MFKVGKGQYEILTLWLPGAKYHTAWYNDYSVKCAILKCLEEKNKLFFSTEQNLFYLETTFRILKTFQ